MKVAKSKNGHFFDYEKSNTCPKCGAEKDFLLNDKKEKGEYPSVLRLTLVRTGEVIEYNKASVVVGRKVTDGVNLDNTLVARIHAHFYYENGNWFLVDAQSTNGTWINNDKLEPNKKYPLHRGDVISFAGSEKGERVIFFEEKSDEKIPEIDENVLISVLEKTIKASAECNHMNMSFIQAIIAILADAPLYFAIDMDVSAVFGDMKPEDFKPGMQFSLKENTRAKILTLDAKDGSTIVPLFTSSGEAQKYQSVSVIRYYPQDYLPMLMKMDKTAIINPFNDNIFVLNQKLIQEVLWPLVQSKL